MSNKTCQDHLGNTYASRTEMLKKYNIPNSTFGNRMKRGWSLEQALTIPNTDTTAKINKRSNPIQDHLGNWYPNIPAMCAEYGISSKVYWSRKRLLKWPLDKILTTPLQDMESPKNANPITCNGIEFKSVNALCRYYNIPRSTFKLRLKQGHTPEEAIKIKPQETKGFNKKDTSCVDPWGNKFKSQNAMYKHYGTTKDIAEGRFEHGWTLEQILLNPEKIDPHKPCIGPDGKEYAGFKIMAEAFGLTESTLRGRLKQGYTLEEAILNWDEHRLCHDHLGNTFASMTDMYLYWNTNVSSVNARKKHHSDLKDVLDVLNIRTKFDENLVILRIVKKDYFEVRYYGHSVIMSRQNIWKYWHDKHADLLIKE